MNGNSLDVDPSDASFQSLAAGDTQDIVVTYDIEDGNGGSVAQTATVTITGTNDTPIAADDVVDASTPTMADEIVVNDFAQDNQAQPSTTVLDNGNIVVVWVSESPMTPTSNQRDIFGEILAPDGSTVVAQFQANIDDTGDQVFPDIAALDNGGFVISWLANTNNAFDGSGTAILGRIFDENAVAQTGEFILSTFTAGDQLGPNVIGIDGGFAVEWNPEGPTAIDGSSRAILLHGFNNDGTEKFPEFIVNQTTANSQEGGELGVLQNGNIIVTWRDRNPATDGNGDAVVARIIDTNGVPVTNEFVLNDSATSTQRDPLVAGLEDGNFVAVYRTDNAANGDGNGTGILARIFDEIGNEVVGEFVVNETTVGNQFVRSVTSLTDGGFVVGFDEPNLDGSSIAAVVRVFNADGTPRTGDILVNQQTAGAQRFTEVEALKNGGFAVVWVDQENDVQDGSGDAIIIRYFLADGTPGGAGSGLLADDMFNFDGADLLANDTDVDGDTLTITQVTDSIAGAAVTLNGDGTISYDPTNAPVLQALGDGDSIVDTFTYTISDGNGGTDVGDVTITVNGEGVATVNDGFTSNTPNTGQQVSISLNTDSITADGDVDAEIDINFGALLQPQINVVYVVDTSGSTIASVLAQQVAALLALTADIAAQGFAEGSVSISIVPFSTTSGPDATGDGTSTFILDTTDDAGSTDVADVNAALNDLSGGGFTNYVEALNEATSIVNNLDPTNSETNVVYFLSDGQPTIRDNTGTIITQTEAEISAAAAPLQAIAQISAFEVGNVNALQFLDALDNTGGATSISDPSDLSAALLGSPIPEGTVIDADLFIFDDSEVFGTLVEAIEIDVPGDIDDPANPNLVETPLGLELDLALSGLASDLGDANRVSLVVQFDDNDDGIVDLPLFVEVDVFGIA